MHYVYILESQKDHELYVGCTKDLRARMSLHTLGKVESTKNRRPLHLIFYEAFLNQRDAFTREQWLKTGWGRNQVQKMLHNFLKI